MFWIEFHRVWLGFNWTPQCFYHNQGMTFWVIIIIIDILDNRNKGHLCHLVVCLPVFQNIKKDYICLINTLLHSVFMVEFLYSFYFHLYLHIFETPWIILFMSLRSPWNLVIYNLHLASTQINLCVSRLLWMSTNIPEISWQHFLVQEVIRVYFVGLRNLRML